LEAVHCVALRLSAVNRTAIFGTGPAKKLG